ncbi:MAG: 4Fe-4S dicluster domain-containing protein [Candidatus Bipolaricaulota bacterium]|nr:4Fe-4S dicluster domain-containing protein [Candidatus Bipolaricaulota bacterium]MBS3791799.1 4Fe-4S dicluster domain-containing protein [Candidatus Bipolaricaulota bacterium]
MDVYRTSESNFLTLLENIASNRELFVPADDHGEIAYKNWDDLGQSSVQFPKNRIGTPPKVFFFPPKEEVSTFPSDKGGPERNKRAVFGLKACDLSAFKVLDRVFLDEEFVDPFYAIRRHDTLLISSDCYQVSDTCFCNKVGGQPYPEERGFDLNVTKTPDFEDLIVEFNPDSLEAQEIYEKNSDLFEPANEKTLEKRTAFRTSREEKLDEQNSFFEVSEDVSDIPPDDPMWRDFAEKCVECGACNLSCPTCHCFQLYEKEEGSSVSRNKVWDSCNFKGYSRVAGGANPMESLESRVRNRFYDKFGRIYENHGFYGCTGCGRCIDGCMGDIDMRDVLKEVTVENKN